MPSKPTTKPDGGVASQRDNRWVETVYDQHKSARFPKGRPWWGHVEYPSDKKHDASFCTELLPGDHTDPFGSTWNAPWFVPQRTESSGRSYFRLDMRKLTIVWQYQAVIADDIAALQAYYDRAAEIAYEKGWRAPEFGEPVGSQIGAILRTPPRSPKIAEAALAGDLWILGLTEQVNEELAALLKGIRPHTVTRTPAVATVQDMQQDVQQAMPTKPNWNEEYKAFYVEAKSQGMKIQDIGKAWQEHKRNLVAA